MTKPAPTSIESVLTELKDWRPQPAVVIAGLALIAILSGSYFSQILALIGTWWREPDYGHGFFVPMFSIALLIYRREMIQPAPKRGSWWGLGVLLIWAVMRWASIYLNYPAIDRLSLVVCATGFTMLLGGWQALHWAWQSIVFLFFMLPLPAFCDEMLSQPLRSVATQISVFVIQIFVPATASSGSNVIHLENLATPIEVADACSGLRMLMLFFAISVGAAMLLRRELWEKAFIVVSAVPIAIIANVIRVSSTGLFYQFELGETVNDAFHTGAGLAMMPIALLLLWGELTLMSKLFIDASTGGPVSLAGTLGGGTARRKPPVTIRGPLDS